METPSHLNDGAPIENGLGLPPRGVEVARAAGFLVVAIAYGGVWLAVAMFFSVVFRSTATSALCALGLWLFFFILWPMIASALTIALAPSQISGVDQYVAVQEMGLALLRLSPGTLFTEAMMGLLNPETRTLGLMLPSQMRGVIAGNEVGQAAALKMIRSVMIKGIEALTAECFLTAARYGIVDEVAASLKNNYPTLDWDKTIEYNLERMASHGVRRAERGVLVPHERRRVPEHAHAVDAVLIAVRRGKLEDREVHGARQSAISSR